MVKQKLFEDCDVALTWHPLSYYAAFDSCYLANTSLKFHFTGVAAHAAAAPHLGRSALDAVELTAVGSNYLREHVPSSARIHYTTDSCGFPPNIVHPQANIWYYVRAPHRDEVREITRRLIQVAKGAAMMTDTHMRLEILNGCYNFVGNHVLTQLTRENLKGVAPIQYTQEELAFARALQATVPLEQVQRGREEAFLPGSSDSAMSQNILTEEQQRQCVNGASSDIGDVSWNCPMQYFTVPCWPLGIACHSWQATASAGSGLGMKGMLYAAKVLSGIMYDLYTDPSLIQAAKQEQQDSGRGQRYINPYDESWEV